MHINIACFDFDGVINDYPGWDDEGFEVVRGEPVEGIKAALSELRNKGWLVLVHSTRCSYPGGAVAIMKYLNEHNIRVDGVCTNKPPADVYIDDKGLNFNGDCDKLLVELNSFKAWQNDAKV